MSSSLAGAPAFMGDGQINIGDGGLKVETSDGILKDSSILDGKIPTDGDVTNGKPVDGAASNGNAKLAASNGKIASDGPLGVTSTPKSNGHTTNGSAQHSNGSAKPKPDHKDIINRGTYGSNLAGTATFVGLRALDPLLQYQILAHGWGESLLHKLGKATIPLYIAGTPVSSMMHETGIRALDAIGLPLPRLILLAMAAGSSAKQIFWLLRTSKEELGPSAALAVSGYNSVINSLASFLLVTVSTSASLATPRVRLPGTTLTLSLPTVLGSIMYVAGMALETLPEIRRRKFKDDPANKGRICNTGLWGKARHINYGGYTLWRTGYALAAGGWTAGAVVAAWHLYTFAYSSIEIMNKYMTDKYGDQWVKYQKEVPYKLFPGIY